MISLFSLDLFSLLHRSQVTDNWLMLLTSSGPKANLIDSASISPQMAFTVPLVPEPWLCQAAPLPDSPSQGPLPLPSHSGRDQTLDGQELSLRNGPSRGFTGLHSYPAMSGARRGCPCLLCPQRWEPAGAAPATPHAAHQTANSFLKP